MKKKLRQTPNQIQENMDTKKISKRKERDESEEISGKNKKSKKIRQPAVVQEVEGNSYADEVQKLKSNSKFWKNIFEGDINGKREKAWDEIEKKSQELSNQFAWAVPDEKALKIIEYFSPLIEIGAGKGYWARLLQNRGVDILPFDKFVGEMDSTWTDVKAGDPSSILKPIAKDRNLFLCYPDEAESIAAVCLENFQGEYIVHVGEMIFTGTLMGTPVAPFGRTSSADFQVSLAESFHCVLIVQLSNNFPISSDCLSVWKRTKFVRGKEVTSFSNTNTNSSSAPAVPSKGKGKAKEASTNSGDDSAVEFINPNDLAQLREMALDLQYNEDEETQWASIPEQELLPIDRAAPFLAHLLE